MGSKDAINLDFSADNDAAYDGCMDSYGCIGLPNACVKSKNCTILLKWMGLEESLYKVNLYGQVKDSKSYLAMGFSADNLMGNDSVVACVGTSTRLAGFTVQQYWNTASPFNSLPVSNSTININNTSVNIVNGYMNCSFTVPETFIFLLRRPTSPLVSIS